MAKRRKSELNIRVPAEGGGGGGLLRYRSAPSSLLGEVCEDLLHHPPARAPPASPPEALLARFLQSTTEDHHRFDGPAAAPPPLEQAGGRRVEGSGGGAGFAGDHHLPAQMLYGASSGILARQNSSPAGLFSSFMDVDNAGECVPHRLLGSVGEAVIVDDEAEEVLADEGRRVSPSMAVKNLPEGGS